MRIACKILVEKSEGKRMWNNIIKAHFKEICCESEHWIQLAQDWVQWRALVNMVFVPSDTIKDGEFLDRLRHSQLFEEVSSLWNYLHLVYMICESEYNYIKVEGTCMKVEFKMAQLPSE